MRHSWISLEHFVNVDLFVTMFPDFFNLAKKDCHFFLVETDDSGVPETIVG